MIVEAVVDCLHEAIDLVDRVRDGEDRPARSLIMRDRSRRSRARWCGSLGAILDYARAISSIACAITLIVQTILCNQPMQ